MQEQKPHFQGRLDVFCAIYAVINALVLTHGLPAGGARTLLHETLLDMADNRELFALQLNQLVEYHDLVDSMLNREVLQRDLLIRTPFPDEEITPKDEVWNTLSRWLAHSGRAAVLRFVRPLTVPGDLEIRHWSTARSVDGERIELFDCSREETAIHEIRYETCLTAPSGLCPGLVYLDPSSIRLLGNPAVSRRASFLDKFSSS